MIIIYEQSFDWNEWFVIITLIGLVLLMVFTKKIFTVAEATAFYLFGVAVVYFFDHTLSIEPWDFYDVNDKSSYEVMDFIYYIMNGPFSYFFVYLYSRLGIRGYNTILYLIAWSIFSVFTEWAGLKIGLFHYEKGYRMYWSFPIYMVTQSIFLVYYHKIINSREESS
ncbi:hypothetical protein D3H55_04975 [Bacillus salacetis]|uniref:Uncharacterized protein n=1 Tax=Bacillus salacetis TaxID=2315464 RepID=A0A3A1R493_9BACI|nr:hypothetical protein [Bacillus salacetis]RIW37389.1 hypothetical protein D3H55_04975 [Bacillus salacetis]